MSRTDGEEGTAFSSVAQLQQYSVQGQEWILGYRCQWIDSRPPHTGSLPCIDFVPSKLASVLSGQAFQPLNLFNFKLYCKLTSCSPTCVSVCYTGSRNRSSCYYYRHRLPGPGAASGRNKLWGPQECAPLGSDCFRRLRLGCGPLRETAAGTPLP